MFDERRICYTLIETEHDERGWIPCVVREDEAGYHKTDWRWDCPKFVAELLIDGMNERMGIKKKDEIDIVASSIRASNLAKAQKA